MHHATSHAFNWRTALPVLSGRIVTLREPVMGDCDALVALLSIPDAARFTPHDSPGPADVQQLIERAARERAAGTAFTYVIAFAATRTSSACCRCASSIRSSKPRSGSARSPRLARHGRVRGGGAAGRVVRVLSVGANRLEARVLCRTAAPRRRCASSAPCRKASCAGRSAAATNTSIRCSGRC